jgi:hypothetical protein
VAALRKEDLGRLSGSGDYAAYIMRARSRFESGQAATVADLRRVYRDAAAAIRRDIEAVTPGTLRAAHLGALATNLERRAKELNARALAAAHKGIYVSTAAGTSVAGGIAEELLEHAFDKADVRRLFAGINERATLALLSRTGKDGLKLSDRVWRIVEHHRKAVTRLVEDGVARGLDSRTLAKQVERYLEPDKWTVMKTETRRRLGVPKDVSYEGMRLARTEMNNAFHEGAIAANTATPSYRGVCWRLSNSHPFPDVCDDYAKHEGNGFWPKGEEPARPHPQCMCVVVPVHEDPQAFAERLRGWAADPASQPELEEWYNGTARAVLKRPSRSSLAGTDKTTTIDALEVDVLGSHGWSLGAASQVEGASEEIRQLTLRHGVEYAAMVEAASGARLGRYLRGTKYEVNCAEHLQEMKPGRGYILMHTHPSSCSFSEQDATLLYSFRGPGANIQSVYVVGADGARYVISRSPGREVAEPATIRSAFWAEIHRLQPKHESKIRTREMTSGQAWKAHTHEAWTNIAARLGLRYDRLERAP